MSNLITDRVAFFLKDFPPFSFLGKEELDQLSVSITVQYFKKNQVIFSQGDENKGFCFVLRQGHVKLTQVQSGESSLVDQCEPGDVFGVRSILSSNPYVMSAIASEESLIYAIPKAIFQKNLDTHQRFALFFASGYAAGQAVVLGGQQGAGLSIDVTEENKLEYSKRIISCEPETSIQEAAAIMTRERVGSIIITEKNDLALGIITDSDLRRRVVAQGLDLNTQVRKIMSSPVATVAPEITVTEVQMLMIQQGIHHLLVTEDGTLATKALGVISDHDILISRLNHPSALLKAIKQSNEVNKWAEVRNKAEEMLKTYLGQEVSVALVAGLISRINDLIIQKAIAQSVERLDLHEVDFCWVSLGSEGREEQLLRTDQDNAIVFADTEDNEMIQKKLLELAGEVNEVLMSCGFEKCPADIMARNPKWCQPLSVWKDYFSDWIFTPDPKAVMHSTIFFDFRNVFGSKKLTEELTDFLFDQIQKSGTFLNHLARNATQNPPPLSFFKHLVVERSGEHAHEFDIKKRGMMPLVDAARVLALQHQVRGMNSTLDRFKALQRLEPKYADLMREAAQAYEIMMRYRAKSGLEHTDSGRFIEISKLNKLEKQIIKNAFQPVKELQEILEVRFNLAYFQ